MITPGAGTEGLRPAQGPAASGPAGASRAAGSAGRVQPAGRGAAAQEAAAPGRFGAVLREKVAGQALRWSRHADARLRQAGITLGEGDLRVIEDAVSALERRGAREGLIVYGDLALVVSVSGNTVITAARPERLEQGVFTQIDGAAVINQQHEAGPQRAGDGTEGASSPWIDGSGLTFRRSIVS